MNRVYCIDYLRGLMALAVLFYHYICWTYGVPDAGTVMGRLGIYAVSTFYIISGMSMYLAYSKTIWTVQEFKLFMVKRYLRLAPAMWVACFAAILVYYMVNGEAVASLKRLLLNLSLVFGFVAPANYITVGGWSIGNEMVFYAVFPFIMLFSQRRGLSISVALIVSVVMYFGIPALMMKDCTQGDGCWSTYILPFNQIFLFVSGVFLAWLSARVRVANKTLAVIAVLGVLVFVWFPQSGGLMEITKGVARGALTLACLAVCYVALNITVKLKAPLATVLLFFGDISYTVYMFHGVSAEFVLFIARKAGMVAPEEQMLCLLLMTPIVIGVSYCFYRFVELKAISLGKNIYINQKAATVTP